MIYSSMKNVQKVKIQKSKNTKKIQKVKNTKKNTKKSKKKFYSRRRIDGSKETGNSFSTSHDEK